MRTFDSSCVFSLLVMASVLAAWACQADGQQPPSAVGMANPVRLGDDGYFRLPDGKLYVPLGGLYGNYVSADEAGLTEEDFLQLEAIGVLRRRTPPPASQPGSGALPASRPARPERSIERLDIVDVPARGLANYMAFLRSNGITCLRLFPRVLSRGDMLDIVGRLNPDMKAGYSKAFAAGEPYGVRFQFQSLNEPGREPYYHRSALEGSALPRYGQADLESLTPAQRRFLVDGRRVDVREFFIDPDVRACQRMFLAELAEWMAGQKQVFALELYNEQGWWLRRFVPVASPSATMPATAASGRRGQGERQMLFSFDWEEQEIAWSADMVRAIKARLPDMPVCLSHPGFGVTAYDPLKWAAGAGVDFYSQHLYANLCGEWEEADIAALTAATGAVIRSQHRNFAGEWGILNRQLDAQLVRRNHRDAIWLSLATGAPGFLQWESVAIDEFRWPDRVFSALPAGFSPQPPAVAVDIGPEYRKFHQNERYKTFSLADPPEAFTFIKEKNKDENYRTIVRAFIRSLDIGVPIRFVTEVQPGHKALSLSEFAALDVEKMPRPIRAAGWQLAYIKDSKSPVYVGYLRSKKVVHSGGDFYLAEPIQRPLTLRFDLPAGRYALTLIDLQAGQMRQELVQPEGEFHVSDLTDHEYALVVAPADLNYEPRPVLIP